MKKTLTIILMLCMLLFCSACGNQSVSVIGGADDPKSIIVSENSNDDADTLSVSISIDCINLLNNIDDAKQGVADIIPQDGIILSKTDVTVIEGSSVYEVLQSVCNQNNIIIDTSFTAGISTAYVRGIANIYEFDCGNLSGWQYLVNDQSPNIGCGSYYVKPNDKIEFRYTCNMGKDL